MNIKLCVKSHPNIYREEGTFSVMVIVIGNGIGDPISNSGLGYLY